MSFLKIIEPIVYPIGFLWLLLLCGALHGWARKQKAQGWFCFSVALLVWVLGATPLPYYLLARLERPYSAQPISTTPQRYDATLMLGGVLSVSGREPLSFNIADAGDRLLAAAQLVKSGRGGILVLGGEEGMIDGKPLTEGAAAESWLRQIGLLPGQMLSLKRSRDTRDEMVQMSELVKQRGWKQIYLVTSAYHMKRAEALARKAGLEVTPRACDFQGLSQLEAGKNFHVIPNLEGFKVATLFVHEWVGWWYYRARGWI